MASIVPPSDAAPLRTHAVLYRSSREHTPPTWLPSVIGLQAAVGAHRSGDRFQTVDAAGLAERLRQCNPQETAVLLPGGRTGAMFSELFRCQEALTNFRDAGGAFFGVCAGALVLHGTTDDRNALQVLPRPSHPVRVGSFALGDPDIRAARFCTPTDYAFACNPDDHPGAPVVLRYGEAAVEARSFFSPALRDSPASKTLMTFAGPFEGALPAPVEADVVAATLTQWSSGARMVTSGPHLELPEAYRAEALEMLLREVGLSG